MVAAEPHGHGFVVGRVGAAAGRVDAAQLALVVLDPALRLLLDQVLRLALAERRDVLERACVRHTAKHSHAVCVIDVINRLAMHVKKMPLGTKSCTPPNKQEDVYCYNYHTQ